MRVIRRCLVAAGLLAGLVPPPLRAQEPAPPDSLPPSSTIRYLDGSLVSDLPLDRIEDAFFLLPGVVPGGDGAPSIRGGAPGDFATYIDGISVTPGFRGSFLGGAPFVAPAAGVALGTNGLGGLEIATGPYSTERGNAGSGLVLLRTPAIGDRLQTRISYETDESFSSLHSLGLNRIEASAGGPLGQPLRFFLAGAVQGQQSPDNGPGSENAPLFVKAGVDTTFAVVDPITSNVTQVDVYRFAMYRGQCDAFSGSANSGIASNYGRDCEGVQIPAAAVSSYQLQGRAEWDAAPGTRLGFLALAGQTQSRDFNYFESFNPLQSSASRTASGVYALQLRQRLGGAPDRELTLEASLSYQFDQVDQGLLSANGELDTRHPFGGFMPGALDFSWNRDNFPIDDALIKNMRTLSGRLTPYFPGVVPPMIYSRANPYATYDFLTGGGPFGDLTLLRESRIVAHATAGWRVGAGSRIRFGGDLTRYSVANYHYSRSTDFYNLDAYREKPILAGGFSEYRLEAGEFSLAAGARLDYFNSRALRPFVYDTLGNHYAFPHIFTLPGFNPADPTALLVRDQSHLAFSPRFAASYRISPRTALRFSAARQARAPDLSSVLSGINTDIVLASSGFVFGSDLGFEKTAIAEVGLQQELTAGVTVDLAVYTKKVSDVALTRLVSGFDPLSITTRDYYRVTGLGEGSTKGGEIRLDAQRGVLRGVVGFTYQGADWPAEFTPEYTVAGAAALRLPEGWHAGSVVGGLFERSGLFATFRYASGMPYYKCGRFSAVDESILSGDPCNYPFLRTERLPAFKQLDLRLTRGFGIAGRRATAYLDVRNVLNLENTLRVFAVNGKTSNPIDAALDRQQRLSTYAVEGSSNGVQLPDSSLDLTFAGPNGSGCGAWVPNPPSCFYFVRAEQRYGNGDGLFTLAEQTRAADALYAAYRGSYNFQGSPRRIRLGVEVGF